MGVPSVNATLPIVDVLNANPAWVREDVTADIASLRDSIARVGIQLPVLMTNDLLVVDGARRVVVAKELGLTEVPVLIARDWPQVREYANRQRELAEAHRTPNGQNPFEPHPHWWYEVNDLCHRVYRTLYEPERDRLRRERRQHRKEAREQGAPRKANYVERHGYTMAMAEVLDIPLERLRAIRDLQPNLARCEALGLEVKELAFRMVRETQSDPKGPRLWSLGAKLQRLAKGELDVSTARQLGPRTANARIYRETRGYGLTANSDVVMNIGMLLTHLTSEMDSYGQLSPDLSTAAVKQAVAQFKTAIPKIHLFRRRLERFLDDDQPTPERVDT